ncbi:protein RRNAD1, partial [Elysia marginata]
ALQTVLQPVIESFIYNDRLLWLMEQGHSNVKVIPVFSETISPRNLALVVIK